MRPNRCIFLLEKLSPAKLANKTSKHKRPRHNDEIKVAVDNVAKGRRKKGKSKMGMRMLPREGIADPQVYSN